MNDKILPYYVKLFNNADLYPTEFNIQSIRTTYLSNFMEDIAICFNSLYLIQNCAKCNREKTKDALLNIVMLFLEIFRNVTDYGIRQGYDIQNLNVATFSACKNTDYYLEEEMFKHFSEQCEKSKESAKNFICSQMQLMKMTKELIEKMLLEKDINFQELETQGKKLKHTFYGLLSSFIKYFFLNFEYYYNGKLLCALKFADQQIQVIDSVLRKARIGKLDQAKKPTFSVLTRTHRI